MIPARVKTLLAAPALRALAVAACLGLLAGRSWRGDAPPAPPLPPLASLAYLPPASPPAAPARQAFLPSGEDPVPGADEAEEAAADPAQESRCSGGASLDVRRLRRDLLLNSGVLAGKLGATRTGFAALAEKMPPLPGSSRLVPIGEQQVAHGVPMNLASFETAEKPEAVLEYYARLFDARGWSWQGLEEAAEVVPWPSISATDPAEDLQLSVMAMEHEDGSGTTVVVGLADMLAALGAPDGADTGDLPRYPGATPLALRSVDEDTVSLTVSFATSDPPARVESFYRDALAKSGYRQLGDGPATNGEALKVLRFASNDRQWSLTIAPNQNQTAVTALSTLREVMP